MLEPKNIQAYLVRGNILFKLGRIQEAKTEYFYVLELDPANDKAKRMLEKVKYKTGEVTYEIKDKRLYNSGHEHKLLYSPR